jgi:hypothetical protein
VRSAAQSPDEKKVLDAFKSYISSHLASYKVNRRERVTKLGGGWVKEYYEPEPEYSINAERTSSLISPYVGSLDFVLVRHYTDFHKTREEAVADSNFVKHDSAKHRHTYAYQDGKWVPKVRKFYYGWPLDKWFDCDKVITEGENSGAKDIQGCLEEYDNPSEAPDSKSDPKK